MRIEVSVSGDVKQMENKKSILSKSTSSHLAAFAWLVFLIIGLIVEVLIQVHYTKIRPHADARTGDVILMIGAVWAWVAGRSLERQDLNRLIHCLEGSALGLLTVAGIASMGHSTPPIAGALMLLTSLSFTLFFKD